MSERKFDNFDGFARNYRQEHTNHVQKISGADSEYFSAYKIQEVKSWERCGAGEEVNLILDLGCGDGAGEVYFRKYFPCTGLCGIDISPESIAVAKEKQISDCLFLLYDGERIPFAPRTFDLVFIAGVFHHINKSCHAGLVQECYRVLKPRGRLYIFEHNPSNPLTRKIVRECAFDREAELVRPFDLIQTVQKAGFRNVRRKYTIFLPRKGWLKKLVFMEQFFSWCPLGGQYYLKSVK